MQVRSLPPQFLDYFGIIIAILSVRVDFPLEQLARAFIRPVSLLCWVVLKTIVLEDKQLNRVVFINYLGKKDPSLIKLKLKVKVNSTGCCVYCRGIIELVSTTYRLQT